jgi:hypothetical protein
MSTTAFIRFDKERQLEMKVTADTWRDVADAFVDFLRGCGYQVDKYDIADYWNDDREYFNQEYSQIDFDLEAGK